MSMQMSWRKWFGSSRKPQQRPSIRPRLEALEDRMLPSANLPYANPTSASQLIADINQANRNGGANTITLGANIQLSAANNSTDGANGLPVIAAGDQLTVVGGGYTIDRSSTAAFRLFDVVQGASLTLENLTLTGGLAKGSGTAAEGGAIYNQGTLTLQNVKVTQNTAQGSNGTAGTAKLPPSAGQDAAGGGIYSGGAFLTLGAGTLIENNQAIGGNGGWDDHFMGMGSESPAAGGGNALGGGLYAGAGTSTVTMTDATISGNKAEGGNTAIASEDGLSMSSSGGGADGGGAYLAASTVNMSGDTINSNKAQAGSGSGVDFSPLLGTTAAGNAIGGGLYVAAHTLNMTTSTLANDSALGANGLSGIDDGGVDGSQAAGGGIFVPAGHASLINDTLANDTAQGGNGGNVPDNSSGNGGDAYGGGLATGFGDGTENNPLLLTLRNDTLSNDRAEGGNGGNWSNGGNPYTVGTAGNGGNASGGGLSAPDTIIKGLSLINDTLANNSVQGGKGGNGPSSYTGGSGGSASGGGAYGAMSASLINDTLAYNSAVAGKAGQNASNTQGQSQAQGGGLYIFGDASVTNTLIAGNTAASGPDVFVEQGSEVTTDITSDHNLIGNSSGTGSSFPASAGNILNPASLGIGTLANNGGPTQTIALLSGSSALKAGDGSSAVLKALETAEGVSSAAALTDQRGDSRLAGNSIDIGAYEHATAPATVNVSVSGKTSATANAGGQITYTLTVTNKSSSAQSGITLIDVLPANTRLVKWTAASGWKSSAPAAGSSGTVTATGSLASKASATFTLVVQVSQGTSAGTVLSNTASLKPFSGVTNTGTSSVTLKTTVVPLNVSADVRVSRGASSYNAKLRELVQTLTITNTSSGPLTGPLAVQVSGMPQGISVADATATYGGNPYVDFVLVAHSLAAGKSATVTLDFNDPKDVAVPYVTAVLQGI